MSSPTIKQHKPSSPLLAAGDTEAATASKQRSDHGKDSGHPSQAQAEAPVVEAGRLPIPTDRMNSSIGESLFRSAALHAPDEEHERAYPKVAPDELLPPPDFKPFFTLIEDPETGEHHHPSVHYVFSDDDEEVLTDATLVALDQTAASGEQAETDERIVVLDMAADGKSVSTATSLSLRWQALKTVIGQAPSWGDTSNSADRGLMLKISGQEAPGVKTQAHEKAKVSSTMEDLAKCFGERLDSLDEVMGRETDHEQEESVAQEPSSIQEASSSNV